MERHFCIRSEVARGSNVQLEKCRKGSGQWVIGRCRCAEDRHKFRRRIRELTGDFARQTSVAEGGICCADPILNRTWSERENSRKILEEIIRIESVLEVLDGCKNVFSENTVSLIRTNEASIQTNVEGGPRLVDTMGGRDSKKASKDDRHLPEHLLAPMRKNAADGYSLGRKRMEHLKDLWQNKQTRMTRFNVSGMSARTAIVEDVHEQCRRPNIKEEDNCILVYGFPPEAINRFILMFSMVGGVLEKKASRGRNWILLWYRHSYDATQACQYDLCRIDGTVIGVTRWSAVKDDPGDAPVSCQCDTGVIRVRKQLRLIAGKLEEFTPTKLRLWNYISEEKLIFTLCFFIMWFIVFVS